MASDMLLIKKLTLINLPRIDISWGGIKDAMSLSVYLCTKSYNNDTNGDTTRRIRMASLPPLYSINEIGNKGRDLAKSTQMIQPVSKDSKLWSFVYQQYASSSSIEVMEAPKCIKYLRAAIFGSFSMLSRDLSGSKIVGKYRHTIYGYGSFFSEFGIPNFAFFIVKNLLL